MTINKFIAPIVATVVGGGIAIGYVIKNKKFPGELLEHISDGVQDVSNTVNAEEKTFGGLTESSLTELASEIYRGVKAEIDGNTLEYFFKSASGKQTSTAKFEINDAKEVVMTFISHVTANSPREFHRSLIKAIEKYN